MVSYCAGRDVAALPMADAELLPFDLWTNRAHAIMLQDQGVLDGPTLQRILGALNTLEEAWTEGRYQLDPALEDVHVNIERYVSQLEGEEIGGRLHTGRSRNDQVACDMRLFLRAALLELGAALAPLISTLLEQARSHADTLMPGFTHHQPAMITTWGHWLCSYAQALCRDLERVRFAFDLVNRNPLGAAAAFGTSWPIDRERTAELLAFERVELNTLDCIGARWELEAQVASTYASLMNHFSVMSQDLILLSHPYWNLIALPDPFVTGSSIMPQKRNPDLAEIIKGKAAWVVGMTGGLLAIPKGNMSGFNRDSQITKYAVLDIVRECQATPVLLKELFSGLTIRTERMKDRLDEGYLAAADFADALARTLNLPFRTCYEIAAVAVRKSGTSGTISTEAARSAVEEAGMDPSAAADVLEDLSDPARVLSWRKHTGAPSPKEVRKQCDILASTRESLAAFIPEKKAAIDKAYQLCRDYPKK